MGAHADDDANRTTGVFSVPVPPSGVETVRAVRASTNVARLVCVAGDDIGHAYMLGLTPLVIGRGSSADVSLRAVDASRRHARVFRRDDRFVIEDLGSVNGTLLNGAPIRGEVELRVGDRLQIGASTIFVLTLHDELESRMQQLQKLETMASLVAGIAHDFNNALMVIAGNLDALGNAVPAGTADLHEMIGDAKGAAHGASLLAKRLITFGQRQPSALDTVEIGPLVDDTISMVRRMIDSRIATVVDIEPGARVRGARDELQQVLLNLFLNARDAMPDGGKLVITGRVAHLERPEALARHLAHDGDHVELSISDTGVGMNEDTLAHAFEPFFTTKAQGKGTGLGLAMVHTIVRRHEGTVLIESVLGGGTTFRIWLPCG